MTARTLQQTLDAAELVKSGMPVRKASEIYGVHRSSIWRALKKERRHEQEDQTKDLTESYPSNQSQEINDE